MEENEVGKTAIEGVLLQKLKVIPTEGGNVMRMLRAGSALMPDFPRGIGEIYFSAILPGAVKAWKLHQKQTQLFAVPAGEIKIVLYDARGASFTLGALVVLALGLPDNYNLLKIPPGVWYGFAAMGDSPALICNCADLEHDSAEAINIDKNDPQIPFKW